MTDDHIRTIEEAATKLENIGHIFAGDKQSRRLAKELAAILQAATQDAPNVLAGRFCEDCKWSAREGSGMCEGCIDAREKSNVYSVDAQAEIARLNAIINTPHADDFVQAMSIEAEHQRQQWGAEGDAGKTPADWFWLVGYLAGKALHSHAVGNVEKAEHHIITTAAACANWHRNMFGKTDMRPGHQEGTGLIAASAPKEPT